MGWQALEKWAKAGKARAIGISHGCQSHVEDILSVSTVPIALNQVMYHVGMGQSPDVATDYKDYMKSQGIVYMSFSTLAVLVVTRKWNSSMALWSPKWHSTTMSLAHRWP